MCGQSWAATSSHKLQSLRVNLLLHELSSSCSSSGKHLLAPAERFSMDCSAGTCSDVILVILSSGCRGISAPWAHPPFPLFPMFSHFFPHTPQHYFHVLPFFTCVFQGAPACGGSSVDAAGSGWKQLCLAGTGWNQLDLAVPGWNWLEPAGAAPAFPHGAPQPPLLMLWHWHPQQRSWFKKLHGLKIQPWQFQMWKQSLLE